MIVIHWLSQIHTNRHSHMHTHTHTQIMNKLEFWHMQCGGVLVLSPLLLSLTSDDEVDVLLGWVAHVVDGGAVVEARVGGADGAEGEGSAADLRAPGQFVRVAGPGHHRSGEPRHYLAGHGHVSARVHHQRLVSRQPQNRGSWDSGGQRELGSNKHVAWKYTGAS